jgi:hypothetical protein
MACALVSCGAARMLAALRAAAMTAEPRVRRSSSHASADASVGTAHSRGRDDRGAARQTVVMQRVRGRVRSPHCSI